MSKKYLVATIAHGEKYEKIAEITHPSIKAYADRIGADFKVISEKSVSEEYIHFEKFQIHEMLLRYERIIFIDTDVIVRDDTPNLFDVVPSTKLGAFNEGFLERAGSLSVICQKYGHQLQGDWDGSYYNTGVLVVSRCHRSLFKLPPQQVVIGDFYEQDYINMFIYLNKVPMFPLTYHYNRMSSIDKYVGENRHASYIIHYAGCPVDPCPIMQMDLQTWEKDSPNYDYKKNILVTLEGGIGDVVDAEPVIRYISQQAYPDQNVVVFTAPQYNRIIEHIDTVRVINSMDELEPDTAYYHVSTYKDMWDSSWKYMNQNLMHVTDFASLLTIRRILPYKDKEIILNVRDEDYKILDEFLGEGFDYNNLVLIHPGRSWESRTFPKEWWEEIIKGLTDNGHHVGIIGKHVDDELGYIQLDYESDKVHNFIDMLELGELFALIDRSECLVTNDSSPVHIAGAFDNWIVLIPTSRHPEHLLAPRGGDKYYKAIVSYKELMDDPTDAVTTMFHGKICNFVPEGRTINDYIPDAQDLVKEIEDKVFDS
jgi:ADP-heptose:LPS heptosyltransferase